MTVGIAEAKSRLTELIRAAERGERVVITRHGKPVVQLSPPSTPHRKVRLGWMRGQIKCEPGWDAPMNEDDFLAGRF